MLTLDTQLKPTSDEVSGVMAAHSLLPSSAQHQLCRLAEYVSRSSSATAMNLLPNPG